jgi:hypothetical protein
MRKQHPALDSEIRPRQEGADVAGKGSKRLAASFGLRFRFSGAAFDLRQAAPAVRVM